MRSARCLLEQEVRLHLERVSISLTQLRVFLTPLQKRRGERSLWILADLIEGLPARHHAYDEF